MRNKLRGYGIYRRARRNKLRNYDFSLTFKTFVYALLFALPYVYT